MKPSPELKTDITLHELVQATQISLDSIRDKLAKDTPDIELPNPFTKYIKEDDVLLEYRVVARTKDGELFNVEGVSHLSRVLSDSMLPEAPMNFENTFNSAVVRPTLNSFMQHIRTRIANINKAANLTITDTQNQAGFNTSNSTEFLT